MKKIQKKGFTIPTVIPLAIVMLLFASLYFIFFNADSKDSQRQASPKPTTISEEYYSYSSDDMEMKISLPADIEGEETLRTMTLKRNGNEIKIELIASQFTTAQGYVDLLDTRRSLKVLRIENPNYNNYDILMREEYFESLNLKRRVYYVSIGYDLYAFSADSPDLYEDLDNIVRSFKYIPRTPVGD